MLNGKTCLITGASRGIGEAIATGYAREQATLVLTARNTERLKQVAARCKDLGAKKVEYLSATLSGVKTAEELAKTVLEKFEKVDVLVNNAGIVPPGGSRCLKGIVTEWEEMVQLNLLVPMTLMHELVPKMVEQEDGFVINISSMSGKEPRANSGGYAASKWGLRGWTLSCYEELREHNVRVCSINPGFVGTDMTRYRDDLYHESMIKPSDVAEAALLPFKVSTNCLPVEIDLKLIKDIKK